jgi:plastocyanin
MRRTAAVLTVLLCALPVLTGCGDDTAAPPASGDDNSTTINIEFSDGSVTPKGERVEVKAGEPVELVVKADEPGELHVHSTPEQELEYGAGTTTLKLTIDQPGVVDVEAHDLEVVVVQLEVS